MTNYINKFQFFWLVSVLMSASVCQAQDVRLTNPSFEDVPHMGAEGTSIEGWFDCGRVLFRGATPPDIHQGSSGFWEHELGTHHGKTYLTLVVREDDSYESLSQKILGTLKKDKCYSFSISLAQSKHYMSATANDQLNKKNFNQPAVFRIYGGSNVCIEDELLLESKPISNKDWESYEFEIQPTMDHNYITIQAFFKTPLLFGYNGNICVDNASMFKLTPCPNEVAEVVEKKKPKTKKKAIPSFKRKKKKEDLAIDRPQKKMEEEPVLAERKSNKPKLLQELQREKIKVGQNIKIEHLYFQADAADIDTDSHEVLDEVYTFLEENNDVKIEIGGHTNSKPKDEYCDKLSTSRASAVADYLINKGIDKDRIEFKGYGKRKPLTRTMSDAGQKKNQRVEIKIISIG